MAEEIRSARRFGVFVILLTLLFRLFEAGLPQRFLRSRLHDSELPIQKEVGRSVRPFALEAPLPLPFLIESSAPADAVPLRPHFNESEAQSIALINSGSKEPDLAKLLAAPLSWSLPGSQPTVLILHTHATESYTRNGEPYTESSPYRSLAEDYNMLSIGDRLAQILEHGGVHVIHDRTLHDYPSYTGAYTHARKSLQGLLETYPHVQLVLDLHRDAAEDGSSQLRTQAEVDGQAAAQLMFVLGCGNDGLAHPEWQRNLAVALKLQVLLQQANPGICRPISLRPQRFNQDLNPGTLLVEVGAAGNSHQEALLAVEALGRAILRMKYGAE